MSNPKKIVQPKDLPVRKSHSQVVTVTGGTLVFIAGMTSRSEVDAQPVHRGDIRHAKGSSPLFVFCQCLFNPPNASVKLFLFRYSLLHPKVKEFVSSLTA